VVELGGEVRLLVIGAARGRVGPVLIAARLVGRVLPRGAGLFRRSRRHADRLGTERGPRNRAAVRAIVRVMAWVKIPKENHPLFLDCLPRDPRISTVNMFGGVAAKVNGQMFAGLFARSAIVKLSEADQRAALALDGAERFDPMGNKRVMNDTILLPESVMDDLDELRGWLRKAFDHMSGLPAKKAKPAKRR
jgi:TfoX/Sxy family transcriptional regulator of competence genes